MEVTNELIEKLAQLARLRVEPEQREPLRRGMEELIGFVEKLQEVDTTGAAPLLHMTTEINQLREDVVTTTLNRTEALQQAGLKDERYFLVPKVIKK